MEMTESLRKFIRDHLGDDPMELLLHASRYQGVEMETAITQIKARRQIKDKLPVWHRNDRLIFPSTLAAEQCSSEITAFYKQRLVQEGDWVCDLTGGLGVDCWSFAQKVRRVTFVEREETCCDAARTNFPLLGVNRVHIIHNDAINLLVKKDERIIGANIFYIDPARRGTENKRLFAMSDCEPDLLKIIDLLPKPYSLIIKLSPMLDIAHTVRHIPDVREVHVVSVKNECKELIVVAVYQKPYAGLTKPSNVDPTIHCINFTAEGMEQSFRFRLSDESNASAPIANRACSYLYEPNASVLKGGAYKSVACRFDMEKLHASSHLYTTDRLMPQFPGRIFEITEIFPFNSRICNALQSAIPEANIAVRNFPLSVDELRKRTGIADGGNIYLFATTLSDNQKTLIKCMRIRQDIH